MGGANELGGILFVNFFLPPPPPGPTPPTFKAEVRKRLEGLKVTVCTNERLVIPDAARLTPAAAAHPDDEEPAVGLRPRPP